MKYAVMFWRWGLPRSSFRRSSHPRQADDKNAAGFSDVYNILWKLFFLVKNIKAPLLLEISLESWVKYIRVPNEITLVRTGCQA